MIFISDMDKCTPGRLCSKCDAPATECIEWEWSDGGRWWERFCLACFDAELAAHRTRYTDAEIKAELARIDEEDRLRDEAYAEREREEREALLVEFAEGFAARQPIPAYWPRCAVAGEW